MALLQLVGVAPCHSYLFAIVSVRRDSPDSVSNVELSKGPDPMGNFGWIHLAALAGGRMGRLGDCLGSFGGSDGRSRGCAIGGGTDPGTALYLGRDGYIDDDCWKLFGLTIHI